MKKLKMKLEEEFSILIKKIENTNTSIPYKNKTIYIWWNIDGPYIDIIDDKSKIGRTYSATTEIYYIPIPMLKTIITWLKD